MLNKYIVFISLIVLAGCNGDSSSSLHDPINKLLASEANNNVSGPPSPPANLNTSTTNVTISIVGEGSISPFDGVESLVVGDMILLNATPIVGYRFDHWQSNSIELNGSTETNVVTKVIVDLVITAVFVQVVAN